MEQSVPIVIDPQQLTQIESLHRGFFYQHLYATASLLSMANLGIVSVTVERDEDIELTYDGGQTYVQVKTRKDVLTLSDISDTLTRFDEIRELHISGQRKLTPRFIVVSNQSPGPRLLSELKSKTWPSDVSIKWPNGPDDDGTIPPALPDISELTDWCIKLARDVPFSVLAPETLVHKIAARVQLACTGTGPQEDHRFIAADLEGLFEQLVVQLQSFPESPPLYRPHESEPEFTSEDRVRLIVGLSGTGKTAWASQVATHSGASIAYYDLGNTDGDGLAASLARELAGQFLVQPGKGLGSVLIPGATGFDALRAVDQTLNHRGVSVTLMVDNIHGVPVEEIRNIVGSAKSINFVLIAQPWSDLPALEALLKIKSETFSGWSIETIAAEFLEAGCPINPGIGHRLNQITGGLPLFVQNAARLTKSDYGGDANAFCHDVEANTHVDSTGQESILARVIANLDPVSKDVVALMSLADIPLTAKEAVNLTKTEAVSSEGKITLALRGLVDVGVLRRFASGEVQMHDAFRINATNHLVAMSGVSVSSARLRLRNALKSSLPSGDIRRISLFLRLLPVTGAIEELIDLTQSEFFVEIGLVEDLKSALEEAACSPSLDADDRFWALDTLVFWDLQGGRFSEAELRLAEMRSLLADTSQSDGQAIYLLIKLLAVAGHQGDTKTARTIYVDAIKRCQNNPVTSKIVRYTFAYSLYHSGRFEQSASIAMKLVESYYEVLGLKLRDVLAKNIPEIIEKIPNISEQQDNLKHLADCLDLYARCQKRMDKTAGLSRWHALKFYDMSHSVKSLVRVGGDIVDEYLQVLSDPIGAREFIESTLFPLIHDYRLMGELVPTRTLYAVVLAYCGESKLAAREFEELSPYYEDTSGIRRKEFEGQKKLVEDINVGKIVLAPITIKRQGLSIESPGNKIGRNSRCPCGSGQKYKRCHGK